MRYIVAVGSELHFTRAAERVRVAQPSLSRQIRNVEEELGVELFRRTRKKVEITEPGRVFIENAHKALLYADRAASMSRAAGAGQLGKLLLGVSPLVDLQLFFRIRDAYQKQYPEVQFQFVAGLAAEQAELVMRSELHAALIELPIRCRGLAVLYVSQEPLFLAFASRDKLTTHKSISARQLKGKRLVLLSSTVDLARETILERLGVWGYAPEKILDVVSITQAFEFVASSEGISIVRASAARSEPKGVIFKPLSDLPMLDFGLVYRRDIRSPQVRNLLRIAHEAFEEERRRMIQRNRRCD
jgi:DNA-binding transcriptional LysR family regulator